MDYRVLGRTGIKVNEIRIGGDGFENRSFEDCEALIDCDMNNGINFFDVYNSNPKVRSNLGKALSNYSREAFVIEGHLGSVWDDGQYQRSRNLKEIVPAFIDLLDRMQLDYVDIGMIHYVNKKSDFDQIFHGEIIAYAQELKRQGLIEALGLSTHNPDIAMMSVELGLIDVILFSINPAYDMLTANENVNILFKGSTFKERTYEGIDPKREQLYQTCENTGVALTVMKGYATASDTEKDYSEILANAPKYSFRGHCMYCGHCAPCSKKIDIAAVNKYLDLAKIIKNIEVEQK